MNFGLNMQIPIKNLNKNPNQNPTKKTTNYINDQKSLHEHFVEIKVV